MRKVILLVDDCSVHCMPETSRALKSVTAIYLPQNNTSRIQPMDARVVADIKTRYKRNQMKFSVNRVDELEEERNIYKVDVLTAMQSLRCIWHELPRISLKFVRRILR